MKIQKGFIQIPVLIAIIVGVLILGGGGYVGVKKYQNYQTENLEKVKITQEKEVVAQETQRQKDLEVEKLKQEVEALKNKKPETMIKPAPAKPTKNESNEDLASIIKEWGPRVAFINCKIVINGTNVGEQSGSAYIFGFEEKSGEILLLTNKHVIKVDTYYSDGKPTGISALPTSCDIKIPGDSQFTTVYNDGKGENPFAVSGTVEDLGTVWIKNPTAYMKTITRNLWDGNCKSKAERGEKILILGYPGIGDQNDITVTDGIISGFDGIYYVTSAKIEHGNSGGVAISVKNNCYLGIPTFVVSGELESLARILDINVAFPN